MNRSIVPALLLGLAVACSSTNPRPAEPWLDADAPPWIYDPNFDWDEDDEPSVYYARGRARILENLNLAEQKAHADAVADIQSFLETTIERLTEAWINESGDNMVPESVASVVNDEMFTREIIEGTLGGVRTVGTYWDGDHYYVRLRYDSDDALQAYEASLEAQLREANRQLTRNEREAMRAELERVLADRRAATR